MVASLSADSPLRTLPHPADEIAARLGPAAEAKWELVTVVDALKDKAAAFDVSYPSGADDTIFFDLQKSGDNYTVRDIRILAMPSARGAYFSPVLSSVTPGATTTSTTGSAVRSIGIAAVLLAIAALFTTRRRPLLFRLALSASAILGASAVTLEMMRGERLAGSPPPPASTPHRQQAASLAALLPLRNALASGGDVAGAMLSVPRKGPAADTARLWRAQWDFQQMKLADVKRELDAFPGDSPVPLVPMLRARLALLENDSTTAALAYQHAISAGPGRDSLWLEMAQSLATGGFEERAVATLRRVSDLGSRDAGTYYARSMLAHDWDESEKILKQAWSLRPVERAGLIGTGLLGASVRRRGPMLVSLSDPREATFGSSQLSSRPIAIPPTAMASVSGEYLQIDVGKAKLAVPNGANLAPVGTAVVDAGRWSKMEQEAALSEAASLVAAHPAAAAYMQPSLRKRIVAAAAALAERNRWAELASLTEGLDPKAEFVPPALYLLRAEALERLHRENDAKLLLLDLARSPTLDRKRDALSMERIADMLASLDQFDAAVKLYDRARKFRDSGDYADMRITQIAMDKRLASQYSTYPSPHFEIHYPQEVSPATAAGISTVLEGELRRLQKWVPVASFKPVVVNIVWWQDFKSVYTGSEDILGFFSGKITLPLAGISDLNPMVVSLITHELLHAMLTQATNNQAPRWFQEGLAQRVEMVQYAPNAFNMYEDDKLFAISILDSILGTSRDGDMVGAAYVDSQTFIRYLESQYGIAGLQKLIASFAAGASQDEALTSLSGKPVADLDAAFRVWGHAEKRVFQNEAAVRYDESAAVPGSGPQQQPGAKNERGHLDGATRFSVRNGGQHQ